MSTAFVGRQPIYKSDLDVYAYEVLYRNSEENHAAFTDGDSATAELIVNIFMEIGLESIVGQAPAFINLTRNFILDRHAYVLPKDRVVLEVLEDIEPETEILEELKKLSAEGFTIALDDYVYHPRLDPLVDLADIIKVDLMAVSKDDLPQHVETLRRSNVQLLAEKVETYEEFELCKQLGFDFYQGYFFCRPRVVSSPRIPVNRVAALRLASQLAGPGVGTRELSNIISMEPSLCYKLLKFVNSAACGLTRKVNSVNDAVNLTGIRKLQTLASLSLMAKAGDDKPQQLIVTSLTRARMCELLAEATRRPQPEMHFLVGLFSILDALLDRTMKDALTALPLAPSINTALLTGAGPLAEVLKCVLQYEQGNWGQVSLSGVDDEGIRSTYLEAVVWTAEATTALAQMS